MAVVPGWCSENLEDNIRAVRPFLRAIFAKQPSQEEFEVMVAFNMVVPPAVRLKSRSASIANWRRLHGSTPVEAPGSACMTPQALPPRLTTACATTSPLHQAKRLRHGLQMRPGIAEIQACCLDAFMQQMQGVLFAVADSA